MAKPEELIEAERMTPAPMGRAGPLSGVVTPLELTSAE